MRTFRFLIIGSGMTAHAAATAIREVDPQSTIGVLGEESFPFYARPPLSKGLWLGKPRESVWLAPVPGVELLSGRRAVALDVDRCEVRDDRGESHRFEELLLATGGRPRQLPFGGDRVIYFRTLADHDRVAGVQGPEVVVIGGGFIGSEIAAALAQSGRRVTMMFPEPGIGSRAYPAELSEFVTREFVQRGVRVLSGSQVLGIDGRGARTIVRSSRGDVEADTVIAGLGIVPNVELARDAGLAVSDGIDVDARLRTSAPHVWAAGDVARYPSSEFGPRRVEHEDNALTMGRTVGLAMAGQDVRYDHLPFFYSDMFEFGYEAVGILDSRFQTVADWSDPFRKGVIYYLQERRVRGVLTWGVFGQVDAARTLIAHPGPHDPAALRGRISG